MAQLLPDRGEPATVSLHMPNKAAEWQRWGAQPAGADMHDAAALRAVFWQRQCA